MIGKTNLNLVILVVLGLLFVCPSAWAIDGNEPTAHWKFDEGEGTIAYDSAGENHGTIYGAQWTTGQIHGALRFDGEDDYVDCGDDESLEPGVRSLAIAAESVATAPERYESAKGMELSRPHGMQTRRTVQNFAEVEIVLSDRITLSDISAMPRAPGSDLEVLEGGPRIW